MGQQSPAQAEILARKLGGCMVQTAAAALCFPCSSSCPGQHPRARPAVYKPPASLRGKKIPCSNGCFSRCMAARPAAGRTRETVHFFARSARRIQVEEGTRSSFSFPSTLLFTLQKCPNNNTSSTIHARSLHFCTFILDSAHLARHFWNFDTPQHSLSVRNTFDNR